MKDVSFLGKKIKIEAEDPEEAAQAVVGAEAAWFRERGIEYVEVTVNPDKKTFRVAVPPAELDPCAEERHLFVIDEDESIRCLVCSATL